MRRWIINGIAVSIVTLYYLYASGNLNFIQNDKVQKKSKIDQSLLDKSANVVFAGGCFWCLEGPLEEIPGVLEVQSGYAGGSEQNPSYKQVASGLTTHKEAVRVYYDPKLVSFQTLLTKFWMQIDPSDAGGQFADRGNHYTTAVFVKNEDQRKLTQLSIQRINELGILKGDVKTQVLEDSNFFKAEEYHQDYYLKNPSHYNRYKLGSGRADFIEKTWKNRFTLESLRAFLFEGNSFDSASKYQEYSVEKPFHKPDKNVLKSKLTSIQFHVTQEDGTERAFKNPFYNLKAAGIYVDIVSNEPLFSSKHKFDSGTGWPSFYQPIKKDSIIEHEDNSFFMRRVEIRSKWADSHLGHVFEDGPKPTGLRYCINSAALRFIPKEKMESLGYGAYLSEVE